MYILLTVRTIQLRLQGIKVWTVGKNKKGVQRILEISFFLGLIIWTSIVILNVFNVNLGYLHSILIYKFIDILLIKIVGTILMLTGLLIFILALISFGKSWRVGIDKKNPGKLITNGIFSISRNPIFLFLDLYFLSTFFNYSTIFFLLTSITFIIGIHFQILEEEKFLLANYGKEYKNYTEKVRRYL